MQTMNKVFEHAGDLVNVKVAHNLMKLIAEGFGEDDDTADSQLRSSAVRNFHFSSYLETALLNINETLLYYLLYARRMTLNNTSPPKQ
jgi:hypothetical protein